MKGLGVFLFFCVGLAAASFIEQQRIVRPTDETFVKRQNEIVQLFSQVYQPNGYKYQVTLGREYNIAENIANYDDAEVVQRFLYFYKRSTLPKGRPYSVMYTQLRNETIYLYELFYHAKDYDTFFKTACWAREFINEELFVSAFTAALVNRKDTQDFYIPPAYTVFPQYFFTTEVLERAYKAKMQGSGKFLGRFVSQFDNTVYVYGNYSNWYQNHNWEQRIAYFTEDIGLNTFYYNYQFKFPFWLDSQKYGYEAKHRGSFFFFVHQQLLARYYMERLSNGMGEIPEFSFEHTFDEGYDSYLSYQNGIKFPVRPDFFEFKEYLPYLTQVENYERRIRDAIDRGFFERPDGSRVNIRNPEGLEVLGNVLESNTETVNFGFYGYPQFLARALLGNSPLPESWYQIYPAALETYQTSLRDPAFYQLFKHYYSFFEQYQNFLTPYTKEELSCPGVVVENVHVSKLTTFFDKSDVSINNALYEDQNEITSENKLRFRAVSTRLNHSPFTVTVNLFSEKVTKVVFRYFLAPRYNGQGNIIPLTRNRQNFFQVDQFVYELKSGKNVVDRTSDDFLFTDGEWNDPIDVLRNRVNETYSRFFSFPDRLVLPKGTPGGLPFYFYVIVTPYQESTAEAGSIFDQFYYGYPFDRPLYPENFELKNMHFESVAVFHRPEVTDTFKYGTF